MKKPFGRRPSGNKPAWKKDGPRDGKPGFSKKKFSGDRKEDGRSGDKPFRKKPFGNREEAGGERRPGDKPFRKKPYGDKDGSGERRFGDKPFKKKAYGDKERTGERKFGDKPFRKKTYGDKEGSGERKFGDKPFRKKTYGDKEGSGERKFGDKPFKKKTYGDKEGSGERRSGDRPYARKPFGNKEGGEKRRFGDKPFGKRSFGVKEGGPRGNKSYGKPGEGRERPFTKPGGDEEKRFYQKPDGTDRHRFDRHDRLKEMREEVAKDEWQVFDDADEANEFVSEARGEKRGGKSSPKAAVFHDTTGTVRLNRFIANTGICSRREADELIEAGVIKVNGKIVTELGTKVAPGDVIHYGDQLLRREKMVYVLLNKPKDYITTTDDPRERKTVMHLVESAGKERIYPVGRLDRNTTGLLLFTNDGDLAERLTHPKYGIRKIYHVSLDKNLRTEDFDKILNGYELEDGFMKADELSFVGDGTDKKEVGIVIHSGRNRIVRRLFEGLGYDVIHLDRVVYAGLTKKNLPRSRFRHLTPEEVGMLRMQVGGDKKRDARSGGTRDKGKNKGARKNRA